MNTNRKIAISVGVLYIIGTITHILTRVVTGSTRSSQNFLVTISANGNPIVLGALFILTGALALALIPIIAYPVLRKYNEILALGYVVFRGALETVFYLISFVSWLLLLPLSQVYQAGSPDAAKLQALANVLWETKELQVYGMIVFALGGLMFYTLLFQSQLVPRWLSVWGIIGFILHLATYLLVMFGFFGATSPISDILQIPIGLQEMALAVWLIVKGFNPMSDSTMEAIATQHRIVADVAPLRP